MLATTTEKPSTKFDLVQIATEIKAAHQKCETSLGDAVANAIEAGRLLFDAKSQVKHGEWTVWIATNCKFGEGTAQSHMRMFTNRIELQKRSSAAVLSIRQATKLIATPKQARPAAAPAKVTEPLPTDPIADAIASTSRPTQSEAAKPSFPLDRVGREIKDPELQRKFSFNGEWRSLAARISTLKKEFETLAEKSENPYASAGQQKEWEAGVSNLHHIVRHVTPFAICPFCGGRKCDSCKQSGFMGEDRYQRVPPEIRDQGLVKV